MTMTMPFSLKMSQDMYQMYMDQIIENCAGDIGIHDDIAVYGKTREKHNKTY